MNVSRINGANRTGGVKSKRTARAGSSGGGFTAGEAAQSQGMPACGKTAGVTSVDALLALQSVPDATTGRARAVKRAENMLDVLEDIKLALLSGQVPQSHLNRLIGFVNGQREAVNDNRLDGVLDEIELRARVELAKFGHIAA